MKRVKVSLLAVALLGAAVWAADNGAKKGEDVTMSGTLSCAACKLAGSPDHKCTKECCQGCIKGGDSALIEDDKGNLYVLISKEKEKPVIMPERMDFLGEKVIVKGIMVEKGGLKGIYVESIDKDSKKAPAEKKKEHKEH